MNITKRLLSLLLVLVMAMALLAGCGKKEEAPVSGTTSSTEDTVNKDTSEDTSNDVEKTEDSTATETVDTNSNGLELPLCEETETISFWLSWTSSYLESPDELLSVQEMEKRTNVHVDWTIVGRNEAQEKFGLMLASGDLCDIIKSPNVVPAYPGGYAQGIADGVLMDCAELVENYMPNFRATLAKNPELEAELKGEDGKVHYLAALQGSDTEIGPELEIGGLVVRQDWLDDLGLQMPETIDEWHDTLVAFRDQKGTKAALMVGPNGYGMGNSFMTAYGVSDTFMLKDNKVLFGPLEEGYRQWIELFRQWYAEGLIDPNFVSSSAMASSFPTEANPGALHVLWSTTQDVFLKQGLVDDEDFLLVAAKSPVLNKGDEPKVIASTAMRKGYSADLYIDAQCENPELVAKWLDYQFTEEAIVLNHYGVEGVTYYVDDNGSYQYTDLILNNPDGLTSTDAAKKHMILTALGRYNWECIEKYTVNGPKLVEAKKTWTNQDLSMTFYAGGKSMNEEDSFEYSTLKTNLDTLVQENTVNFITGAKSMDEYDEFIDKLYEYGVERCIELNQKLYDEYLAMLEK